MSTPMEHASLTINTPGRPNSTGQAVKKDTSPTDDLSLKHVGMAVGIFAVMVGLVGYGFYVQQQRITAKEAEMKIAEVTTVPQTAAPTMLSAASAQAAVPQPVAPVTVKEDPVAAPGRIESIHADIYFDFGKTRLRADAIATLQQQAQILKQEGNWVVLIQGYTDKHGSIEYNKALALRRGESVKQFLTELGIPAASMKVVSLGQEAALCDDHTPTCTRLNRRVHVELVKLGAPIVSRSPVSPQPGSDTISAMTTGESPANESGTADLATPESVATQATTIPSSESH